MNSRLKQAGAAVRELMERPGPSPVTLRPGDLRFFLRFVRPVWTKGAAALVLMLAACAFASLIPLSSKIVIDYVVLKQDPVGVVRILTALGLEGFADEARVVLGSLNHVILLVLAVSVIAGVLQVAQRYLMVRFQQELTFNLQTALLDHVLRFPVGVFLRKQTGYLMARISDDVRALEQLFGQRVSQLLASVFYLAFGVGIAFALSRKLALVAIAILPVYVAINVFFAGRVRRVSRDVMESRARVSRDLQESLSGIELVKSFAGEDQEVRKVAGRLRAVIRNSVKRLMLTFLSNHLVRAVQLAATLLILWVGVREIFRGGMSIGDFVAFNSYVVYLSAPVRSLSLFHMGLQPILVSLERILELFRTAREPGAGQGGARPEPVKGEVTFDGVDFAYEPGRAVLRDVRFTARPGEVVALVGPSGGGKSTLVSLILGFYRPDRGAVLLDGLDLLALDLSWLRRRVGFVPQEGFLFADSVFNNIRYGRPDATEEEVIEAARAAQVHEDIEGLAQGYHTMVGERGVGLSVGQKQRVSIARCFLKNPSILIFDEPTSALDARSESLLKSSLKRLIGKRTTFIIAHRLSTIDFADTILVLDAGRIVEQGTHAELMAQAGLYRSLHEQQFGISPA